MIQLVHTIFIYYNYKKNTYEYANLFSTCDKNIKDAKGKETPFKRNCENQEAQIPGNIKDQFKDKCAQTLSYLNEIQQFKHGDNNLEKALCLYLYYWLYDSKTEGMNGRDIKELYHKLITVNNLEQDERCKDFKDITIAEDELSKLKDIYEIYNKINKLNVQDACSPKKCECAKECANIYKKYVESCRQDNATYFCNELINIKEKYEKVILNLGCNNDTPKTLPSFQTNNTTVLTLIPVSLTIVIFIFVCVLYKVSKCIIYINFTPYGSCFLCSRVRKKNNCNNIDHYINTLQLYEISNGNFHNKECHILYNSS
ncbi:variable surface protein [Plasmodium gonderi]|uniref:Variable surface protein n=1 Tax=Plasmodium gonderi TaxID=77519 RepID=A0A1Y1JRE6_PLAGO|nr:variable surface protein [Plasmodium gonderi]GAW84065.1 variable surface protein [Plasmodium gonderi]